jgi:uncharacterized lipoprotein YajG
MNPFKAGILIAMMLLLAGTVGACNKGQKAGFFDLHPRILIHESGLGSGKNLKISVMDKRRRNILLRKDSDRKIKSGRALVTQDHHASVMLDSTFQQTAEEAFQLQGYHTDGKGIGSAREVTIYITKLELRIRRARTEEAGGQHQIQARLRSKMKVAAKNQGITFDKEYEFFIKNSYDTLPSKLESEKILNYGLTQLLHQIVDDPKLNRFLTG